MKLAGKLSLLFTGISVIPIAIIGALAYDSGRRSIEQETIRHLHHISALKESQLRQWAMENVNDLESLAQSPYFNHQLTIDMVRHKFFDPHHAVEHRKLVAEYFAPALRSGHFFELFIMRIPDGLILLSTDPNQEGKFRDDQPYFIYGQHVSFTQEIYYSIALEQPTMTVATPIKDQNGRSIAVLASRINLTELTSIIGHSTLRKESEDSYLVNSFNFFITDPKDGKGFALKKTVHTKGVKLGLTQNNGVASYLDYRGEPVIGAYRWIPQFRMCLLTEIDQAEAFAPVNALGKTILELGLVMSLVAGLIGWGSARRFTRPTRQLASGIEEVGRGNLDFRVGTLRKDEIGELSQAFDRMASRLKQTMVSCDTLNLEVVERQKIQERLHQEVFFAQTALDSLPGLFYLFDHQGRLLRWNTNFEQTSGYSSQELSSMSPEDFFEGNGKEAIRAAVQQVFQTGQATAEADFISKNHTPNPCFFTGQLFQFHDKPCLIGMGIDISARKQAEASLRASEERFRQAVENIPDVVVIYDQDLRIQYINEATRRLTGRPTSDFIGKREEELWPPEVYQTYLPTLQEALKTRKVQAVETDLLLPLGGLRSLSITCVPLHDEDGTVREILGITHDFTERKQRELERAWLQDIIARSLNELYVFDSQTLHFRFVNTGARRNIGYSMEELAEMTPLDIKPTFTKTAFLELTAPLVQKEKDILIFETIHRRKNGSDYPVEVHLQLLDTSEDPVFLAVIADITERKRAEKTLMMSEERLRLALSAANQGLYDLNVQTGEAIVSPEYVSMMGYDPADFQETNAKWRERLHPEDREQVACVYEEYISGKRDEYRVEFRQKTKSGDWQWILSLGKVVSSDDQGRPLRMLGTHTDITARKRIEQEIIDKNVELERFVYTVSHDLKSPVVTIKTFLGYLKDDLEKNDPDRVQQNMGFMVAAADKMGHLLDDLLQLSRIGRMQNPQVRVQFRELVDEAVSAVAGRLADRGVAVHVADVPLALVGDRQRLSEIWQNLIENATKYMGDQPEPCIDIGVDHHKSGTVFFVRDNGQGIDPKYQEKIFGLFEKLDSHSEGTGIGLALVKRIVEICQGTIWVESKGLGQGACFWFTLPKAVRSNIKEGSR